MDKLYTKENIPVTKTNIAVDPAAMVAEQLKKAPLNHTGKAATQLSSPLENKFNGIIKRSIDIIISTIIIVCILSWLIPILALLIKLDSKGPVFFLQKRNKNGGHLFTCIKLRTMVVNEEADLVAASDNDQRITRFGNFLRNHYLDELPQFINVLSGDMSIIGPRPHMLSDNSKYEQQVANYSMRHYVKPGITGLAQVLGYSGPVKNIQTIQARIKMDLYYIRHWSPKLDRVIFYRTICKILGI